jgi:hypothetical protein
MRPWDMRPWLIKPWDMRPWLIKPWDMRPWLMSPPRTTAPPSTINVTVTTTNSQSDF